MYCCPLRFNSTSSSVKKLKCSYNSVLRRLLCIRMPYSASAMFVTHGIPSFYELLRKCLSLTLSDPGYFRQLTIRGGGGL